MSNRKLTVYIPEDLVKGLRIACVNYETTLSSVFADMAESYVAKPFNPKNRDRRKLRRKRGVAI